MNSNQTTGLNIDTMLHQLEDHVPVTSTFEQTVPAPVSSEFSQSRMPSVEQPSLTQSPAIAPQGFSLDALSPIALTTPVEPAVTSGAVKSPLRIKAIVKTAMPIVGTIAVIAIGGWVASVQYPIETKTFFDGVFGVFDAMKSTSIQALEGSEIVSSDQGDQDMVEVVQVHNVAPDPFETATPLTDALLAMEQANKQPTSQESLIDQIVGSSGDTLSESSDQVPVSTPQSVALPSILPSLAQVQAQLLELSQSAEEAMTNLIGGNSSKQARVRVIYKNAQDMLQSLLNDPSVIDQAFVDELNTLQGLYDGMFE